MFNLFLATVSSEKRPQIEADKVRFQAYGKFSKTGHQIAISSNQRLYYYASVHIINAYFSNCVANDLNLKWQMSCGGAIFLNKGSLFFERKDGSYSSSFDQCQATDKGGAIYAYDSACDIFQVNFFRCKAGNEGGAYYHDGMRYSRPYYANAKYNTLIIEYCTFKGNLADSYGGALAVKGAVPFTLKNTKFLNNGAVAGGALYGDYSDITMTNNLFVLNFGDHTRHCQNNKKCGSPNYQSFKYVPAGAILIRSSPEYFPVDVYSSGNCFNQNYLVNNRWPDKSKTSVNILLLFAVRFKSVNDKMKWHTVNVIDNMTLAKEFNYPKEYPSKYIQLRANGINIRSFEMTGTRQDVEGCKIDGFPAVTPIPPATPIPTPYPTVPTPDPTRSLAATPYPTIPPPRTPFPSATIPPATKKKDTPFPTHAPPQTPAPTPSPIPTREPTAPPTATPAATRSAIPTPISVPPTINITFPTNASVDEEINTTDCGEMCKTEHIPMRTPNAITINYESPVPNTEDSANNAKNAVIGRNTAAPDESAVGFVIAAVAAVAAVGVIAGIIYTLTRSKPPPMDLENAERVNMGNDNNAVENDNPIYNNNAAQDPFADEFEDA